MKIKGFTLVELMVVVAVIALLAAIAYPTYQGQIQNTRRTSAEGCLVELAQYMERYYTTKMTYASATLPTTSGCASELADYYTFSFDGTPNATSFTLQATPKGTQASDSCGTLKINNLGTKTPSTAGCWKK